MAKASAPGRTKTRLAPPLSPDEAAAFNTAFLQDTGANLLAARDAGAPLDPYMAFGPPGSEAFFERILPPGIGLIETWWPEFGECLWRAASGLFDRGHAVACLLNADSPTLPTALLVELTERLARPGDRAVLGPSEDGGYWVLGIKARHRRLFEEIAWSTEHVARQTLERAAEIGLPVELLPAWYDVDDRASLERLIDETLGRGRGPGGLVPHRAPATAALLSSLIATSGLRARVSGPELVA